MNLLTRSLAALCLVCSHALFAQTVFINEFPNPVDERLSVRFFTKEKGEVRLAIVNPLGVEVFQEKMILHEGEHHAEMDVSKFKSGAYTLVLDAEWMKRRAVRFVRAEE